MTRIWVYCDGWQPFQISAPPHKEPHPLPSQPPLSPQELRSYNLKSPVGDAAWLPIAPTVFAAVTENGWIHVTDLAQNPWQPLCVQKVCGAGESKGLKAGASR